MRNHIIIILIIGTLACLHACFSLGMKEAKFERDIEEVRSDLKALKNFDDTGIKWMAISTNSKTTHLLKVQLLNGKELSEDDQEMRELGKEVMKIVINSIENESDYDTFQVVFIQKTGIGPLSSGSSRPFTYQLEDLQSP